MARETGMIAGVGRRDWIERLPADEDALREFPVCTADGGVELTDVRITGASFAGALVVERPELVNVAIEACDVAGFVGRGGRASCVRVAETRLRGVHWTGAVIQDVVLDRASGSDVALRFSTLRRVRFRECVIESVDLAEATLDDVRFEGCVLRGAVFRGAHVNRLRIERCDLAGCTGAEALAGASVHPDDLLTLGPSLAAALGLRVSESDD